MPYSIEYIEKEFGIIVSWTGNITSDDLIRSYKERFAGLPRLKKLLYMITDYSRSADFDITPEDIQAIAEIANNAAKCTGKIYAVAVMPTKIKFGMARMFQSYVRDDSTGCKTNVVHTRKEAESWLQESLDISLTFKN